MNGALVVYVDALHAAQAIVAAQDWETVLWSDVSVWEPDPGTWRSVDDFGDSAVALYEWEIVKTRSDGYSKPIEASRLAMAVTITGFGALAFAVVYLIGGGAGSSVGDRSHDLVQALFVACITMAFVGVPLLRRRRRLTSAARPSVRSPVRPRHRENR